MASPAGILQGREVMLLKVRAWALAWGGTHTLVVLVTGSRGHHVEIMVLLHHSSNPGNSQGAFLLLHPDVVAPTDQRGGEAAGSQPEVETLCFLWVFLKLLFGPVANPVGGTGVRN